MAVYRIGDTVSFTYKGEHSHEDYPQVLILHTSWRRTRFPHEAPKVHAIQYNTLTDSEINYLKSLINPKFAKEMEATDPSIKMKLSSIGYYNKNPSLYNINSPRDFYYFAIKPFVRSTKGAGRDPYRLYFPEKMLNPKIVVKVEITTGQEKGMFANYINKFKNLGSNLPSWKK